MVKHRLVILIVAIASCFAFVGCSSAEIHGDLTLCGDVENAVDVNVMWEQFEKQRFDFEGEAKRGVSLTDMIASAKAHCKDYDVFLVANDGFSIKLDADTIDDTFIAYSDDFGFHFLSDKHPVNSRIKNISEIIVRGNYAAGEVPQGGIHIITDDYDVHKSMGELLSTTYEVLTYEDGIASLDDISISVMKQKRVVRISSLVNEKIDSLLVMDLEGNHEYIYVDDGYLEIDTDRINFFTDDKSVYYKEVEGVIINPPSTSVMNAFCDSQHYLENDDKVLMLFIDGFSYNQYEYIRQNNKNAFLSNIEDVKKATTVYKPVTNAGFAAMITGASPKDNGILNRDYREVQVDTIFDIAGANNKRALLVEGDIKILNTKGELILNIDSSDDGYTDDEVFESAIKAINDDYDFMLVHFHGVDDAGHDAGAFGDETISRIEAIDGYAKELVEKWDGKVIIVSDHGMHDTQDGGDHGEFRCENMFIPYVIMDGGEYEK